VKNRVGGPILMTNSSREQKKNKVIVCSILVNRKKFFNLSFKGLNDFWVCFFIFGRNLKFYYRGHVDVATLTSFYLKEDL
jgi:hypothetical protein